MSIRPVKQISSAVPTMEGAGVKLHRAFGFSEPELADPFLLFDDFRNDHPEDYPEGLSVAPSPRDRDHHLRSGRHGRPW